jgi:hypothetical protein
MPPIVRFIFGYDARANLIGLADALPARAWASLERPPAYTVQTEPRPRPANVKEGIIVARAFKNLRLDAEAVAEFPYQPVACAHSYRMVVVRKNISVEQPPPLRGDPVLLLSDERSQDGRGGRGLPRQRPVQPRESD